MVGRLGETLHPLGEVGPPDEALGCEEAVPLKVFTQPGLTERATHSVKVFN